MNEVIERDNSAALQGGQVTPMRLLEIATQQGADIEKLSKLMDLQERWEKKVARGAFDEAMAAAKAEIPVIQKKREVDFTSTKGRTHYFYEDLAEIARTVDPILAKHGLSYRFRTSSLPNEPVTVTCIIAHRGGHSEENTLSAGKDESGNKNSIQAVGSTLTYLQRMTLKAALGLAAGKDTDGRGADGEGSGVDESTFTDFVTAIDAAVDTDALEAIWKTAVKACNDAKDKESYEALKAQVAKRGEQLKKPKAKA
jgi:hypothetical protein